MPQPKQSTSQIRRVKAAYSHRITVETIAATYSSAEHAFEVGDYLIAARHPKVSPELQARALAFAGHVEKAVELFVQLEHVSPSGLLAYGFALWCLGIDNQALGALARIPPTDPEYALALDLSALIRRPEIPAFIVACQMPHRTSPDDDALQPSFRCGQFHIKHVATQLPKNAYDYDPADPFDRFIDALPPEEKPLFVYAGSPQWMLPKDFAKANVPKIMWAHDSDFFVYRNYERFQAYDMLMMSTSQEHYELSRALGMPCYSNILSDPMMRLPQPEGEPNIHKPIDVIFSGSSADGITNEKAHFIYALAGLADDYNISVVDGHLPEHEYMALLSTAKFLPIVNRYYGNPSPRWRDALSSYTYVLSPDGVPYEEFCRGFFPFSSGTLEKDIRRHLEGFASQVSGSPYEMGAVFKDIRERFPKIDRPQVYQFERSLKYCALLSLKHRHSSGLAKIYHPKSDDRLVWLVPIIDGMIYGRENVTAKVEHLIQAFPEDRLHDARRLNELAAFHVQLGMVYFDQIEQRTQHASTAVDILQRAIKRFPSSLLLRFNHAHWRFVFRLCPPKESLAEFRQLIAELEELEFTPLGDDVGLGYSGLTIDRVFPIFDYGEFLLKQAVQYETHALPPEAVKKARNILRSALHGFVGWSLIKEGNPDGLREFDAALAIDPLNLTLMRLKLDTLLERISKGDASLTHHRDAVRTFYDAVDVNPALLSTHAVHVMGLLRDLEDHRQLSALLDDWYRYRRIFYRVGSRFSVRREWRELDNFLAFRKYYPESIRRGQRPRSLYRAFRTGSFDLSAKLFARQHHVRLQAWKRCLRRWRRTWASLSDRRRR